jgi:hypothetical protein
MLNVRALRNLVPKLHTSTWYLVRLAFGTWRSRLCLVPILPSSEFILNCHVFNVRVALQVRVNFREFYRV